MRSAEGDRIRTKLYELCPEMDQWGIAPVVLHKGERY